MNNHFVGQNPDSTLLLNPSLQPALRAAEPLLLVPTSPRDSQSRVEPLCGPASPQYRYHLLPPNSSVTRSVNSAGPTRCTGVGTAGQWNSLTEMEQGALAERKNSEDRRVWRTREGVFCSAPKQSELIRLWGELYFMQHRSPPPTDPGGNRPPTGYQVLQREGFCLPLRHLAGRARGLQILPDPPSSLLSQREDYISVWGGKVPGGLRAGQRQAERLSDPLCLGLVGPPWGCSLSTGRPG